MALIEATQGKVYWAATGLLDGQQMAISGVVNEGDASGVPEDLTVVASKLPTELVAKLDYRQWPEIPFSWLNEGEIYRADGHVVLVIEGTDWAGGDPASNPSLVVSQ